MHLTVDGFRANPEKLASEALVKQLLDRLPDAIGMTKISVPHVQRYVGERPEDWGVSGFVLIAESHIALHTFPDHGYVWADIFSCKGFDAHLAIRELCAEFEVQDVRRRSLERGLEYPHILSEAIPVAELERQTVEAGVGRALAGSAEER
jgi:S-adenosylmethionine decarboxylase